MQTLTQVVVYVFTPSLLIGKVASTISLDRFWQWWPLPVFALCLVGIGCTLGTVVGVAFRLPPTQRRLVMAALSFKNNQSIPLALVPALASSLPQLLSGPTDTPADAATRAAGYVLFFTAIVSALRWTIGAFLMRPPASEPERTDDGVPLAPLNGTAANGPTNATTANGSATDAEPKDEEHVGLMLESGEAEDGDGGDGDDDGASPVVAPTISRWRRWWAACRQRVASGKYARKCRHAMIVLLVSSWLLESIFFLSIPPSALAAVGCGHHRCFHWADRAAAAALFWGGRAAQDDRHRGSGRLWRLHRPLHPPDARCSGTPATRRTILSQSPLT